MIETSPPAGLSAPPSLPEHAKGGCMRSGLLVPALVPKFGYSGYIWGSIIVYYAYLAYRRESGKVV